MGGRPGVLQRARSFLPFVKVNDMTTIFEKKAPFWEEIRARVARMTERLNAVPIPPDPWLRGPNENDADIRRTIARLRAGVILPRDPTVDPIEHAAILESRLVYRKAAKEFLRELREISDLVSVDVEGVTADQVEKAVEVLHTAKHLPAAKDPNSSLFEHIRRIDRARRHDLGRPRKRKKK
jgi:hypothetical protein